MEQVNKIFEKFKQSKDMLRIAGLVILLILATSFYFDAKKTSEMEEYIESYKAYQEQVQVILQENAALKKSIDARTEQARKDSILAAQKTRAISRLKDSLSTTQDSKTRLESEIDSLRQVAPDTTEVSLKKDTVIALLRQDSTVTHDLIVTYELRDIDRLSEIALHKDNTKEATFRAEKAEAALNALPPAPKDPDKWFFGLLSKPSRKVVAVITAITTSVVTVVVIK